jgi:hypothetical protein
MIKEHFRVIGMHRDTVDLTFLQNGFKVCFLPQFGSDEPDPDGTTILFSEFDDMREESKEINPEYEISEYDKLEILKALLCERLSCPISRGMRIAYSDVLEVLQELRREPEKQYEMEECKKCK